MGTTWLRALAAFAGLGLIISTGVAQGPKGEPDAPAFKQIRLTEKQVQSFIAAQKKIAPLADKLEAQGEKGDPALHKEIERIATSHGFASLEELGNVGSNIAVVLSGLDPDTGAFTEPPEQLKKEMEELKRDKDVSPKARQRALAEMEKALKVAAPLQFKENIALVKKHRDALEEVLALDAHEPGSGRK